MKGKKHSGGQGTKSAGPSYGTTKRGMPVPPRHPDPSKKTKSKRAKGG